MIWKIFICKLMAYHCTCRRVNTTTSKTTFRTTVRSRTVASTLPTTWITRSTDFIIGVKIVSWFTVFAFLWYWNSIRFCSYTELCSVFIRTSKLKALTSISCIWSTWLNKSSFVAWITINKSIRITMSTIIMAAFSCCHLTTSSWTSSWSWTACLEWFITLRNGA